MRKHFEATINLTTDFHCYNSKDWNYVQQLTKWAKVTFVVMEDRQNFYR